VVVQGADLPENPPQDPNEPNGESRLLSFVVHLWKEETSSMGHQTIWRGHVTPVPDGKRFYFTKISEISDFIAAHLKRQE
jgi:hypothetical protein